MRIERFKHCEKEKNFGGRCGTGFRVARQMKTYIDMLSGMPEEEKSNAHGMLFSLTSKERLRIRTMVRWWGSGDPCTSRLMSFIEQIWEHPDGYR